MITEKQVREAAEFVFEDTWGYGRRPISIDGKDYLVDWVHFDDSDDEYSKEITAVFKIELEGFVRYFAKRGLYRSHYGYEWDGEFFECVPTEITSTQYLPGTTVKKLTPNEVENALVDHDAWDSWFELGWFITKNNKISVNNHIYEIRLIEDGTDRRGREYSFEVYVVFSVGNQVFKKSGHFQSHYGSDWDNALEEVVEVEKTIKVWETV